MNSKPEDPAAPVPLMAPSFARIIGTYDTSVGMVARVSRVYRGPDETVVVDYAGGTDEDTVWNNQTPVLFRGQGVFVDEAGRLWLDDQLMPRGGGGAVAEPVTLLPYNELLALVHRIHDIAARSPEGELLSVLDAIEESGLSMHPA